MNVLNVSSLQSVHCTVALTDSDTALCAEQPKLVRVVAPRCVDRCPRRAYSTIAAVLQLYYSYITAILQSCCGYTAVLLQLYYSSSGKVVTAVTAVTSPRPSQSPPPRPLPQWQQQSLGQWPSQW
jgi:hypothetical protein